MILVVKEKINELMELIHKSIKEREIDKDKMEYLNDKERHELINLYYNMQDARDIYNRQSPKELK